MGKMVRDTVILTDNQLCVFYSYGALLADSKSEVPATFRFEWEEPRESADKPTQCTWSKLSLSVSNVLFQITCRLL